MSKADLDFLWLPLFTILVAIPMALGKIPLNRLYGFRTSKTLSSPDIWYRANRLAGWDLLIASVAGIALYLILKSFDLSLKTLVTYSSLSFAGLILAATGVALYQLSRL